MAKSKLVQANAHIAERVTGAFAAVQDTVVSSYTKVEDAFVDRYLTREGESLSQAKERLRKEEQARQHPDLK